MQKRFVGVSKQVLTAVLGVAALSVTAPLAQAATTITSIGTQVVAGSASVANDVDGQGLNGQFGVGKEYDVVYSGSSTKITSVNTAVGTYVPAAQADYLFRRSSTPNNDIVYYRGAGASNNSTVTLAGESISQQGDAFAGNTISLGVDNIFGNIADRNGNVTNIERLDMVFRNGLIVTPTKGFGVIERGNLGEHDAFGIVAITGIDQAGNPTAYGNLLSFGIGTWGNTALTPTQDYIVMRKDNEDPNGEFGPSAKATNTLGGTFLQLTDLAPEGSVIYGFSLVAGDVTASGDDLVDWTSAAYYPKSTSGHNASLGGLDPTGTLAQLYVVESAAVPEPATAGLLGVAAMALLGRRSRRV